MTLNVPDAADRTSSYLADLLEDTREELTRADSKAALLLAATGVAVGALLAGLLGGRWSPFTLDNRVEWIWWLGVAFAASGIFWMAAAVYPRIHRRGALHPEVPAFYGDVARYADIDAFRQAIEPPPDPETRLLDQTFLVSGIVQRKYVLLRRGLRLLLASILACAGAVLLNVPLLH
jgi:MFS family permease